MLEYLGIFLHLGEVFHMALDFRADLFLSDLLYYFFLFILNRRWYITSPKGESQDPLETTGAWPLPGSITCDLLGLSFLPSPPGHESPFLATATWPWSPVE